MNKSGGITPVGSPRGFNTTRPLPAVPSRGSDATDTGTADAHHHGEHGAPELQTDSSNLYYAPEECGHGSDEGEFNFVKITGIELHDESDSPRYERAFVVDPQAAGHAGVDKPAIPSASLPTTDKPVDLLDFLADMQKDSKHPKQSARLRFQTQGSGRGTLDLKKVRPQTHDQPDTPPSKFVPASVSPSGQQATMSPPRRPFLRTRPLSQAVSTVPAEGDNSSPFVKPRIERNVVRKTVSTGVGQAVAPIGLTQRDVSSQVPTKSQQQVHQTARVDKDARKLATHQRRLKKLESDLAGLDRVYAELLTMTSGDADDAVTPQQDKSENS